MDLAGASLTSVLSPKPEGIAADLLGGPRPESPVARALREEIKRRLEQPLTVSGLRGIGRVVTASIKALQATEAGVESLLPPPPRGYGAAIGMADPDAVDLAENATPPPLGGLGMSSYGTYGTMNSYAPAPAIETFGSNAFREGAAALMKFIENKDKPKVDKLVESLARAKEAGLGDSVTGPLEKALAKALGSAPAESPRGPDSWVDIDGKKHAASPELRTVSPLSVVVSDSTPPEVPATVMACPTSSVGPA